MSKKVIIALLIIPQILLIKLLSQYPQTVENYYSQGLYPYISKTLRFLLGWIPFSVGDMMYTLLAFLLFRWLFINRKQLLRSPKVMVVNLLYFTSMVYFVFHLFWGINYYRIPIHESLKLKNTYTSEELISNTKKLITKVNASHFKITKNDSLKIEIPYTKKDLLKKAPIGYQELQLRFAKLSYTPVSLKTSVYSLPLTYMGFSGYLNPFTHEGQIDGLVPKSKLPSTASHEIAHQIGYAAENEANFIGFLATIHHKDPYFNHSGYVFALKHCLKEIFNRDKQLFDALMKTINYGVILSFKELEAFWDSYQNPLEPLFKKTYSRFLKINHQSKGIESYRYDVALIINYLKSNPVYLKCI